MNERTVFVGMTLLAACACGAGAGLASVATAAGTPIPPGWPYAALLLTGGLVVLQGLGPGAARLPAVLGLAALLGAGLLAPPRVMRDELAHSAGNLLGFALYVIAAALLVFTFLRAYRAPVDGGLLAVLGSTALAAGCTCCLTPGAIRYGLLSTGGVPSAAVSRFALVALAVVVALAGFWLTRNRRAAAFFAGGVLLVYPVEKLVEALVPSWQVGEASLTFLLRYPVWLAGTGLVLYAAGMVLRATRARRRHVAETNAAQAA